MKKFKVESRKSKIESRKLNLRLLTTLFLCSLFTVPCSLLLGQQPAGTNEGMFDATVKLPLVERDAITWTSGAIPGGACTAAQTWTITSQVTTSLTAGAAYLAVNSVNLLVCNPTAGSLTASNASDTFTFVPQGQDSVVAQTCSVGLRLLRATEGNEMLWSKEF